MFLLRNAKMFPLDLHLLSAKNRLVLRFLLKMLGVVKRKIIVQGSIKTTAVSDKKCLS